MRRILLLTVPFFLFACVADGVRGAEPPPSAPIAEATAPTATPDETGAAPATMLSVNGSASDGKTRLHIQGQLDSPAPAIFRLRTELGCARDTKLDATRSGNTFSLGLRAEDLAEVLACAIDAESGDATLSPITVTPEATSTTTATDIRLDTSFFAVVAADLDARSGHVVRFTVVADGPLSEAHVTLGGATYSATLAPINNAVDEETMAIFEVPARAWATAVIDGADAHVDAKLESGDYRSIVVKPAVRVETIPQDQDDDGEDA